MFTYLHEKATEASQNSAPSGSWAGWHVSSSFPFHFCSVRAALRGYCLTSEPTTVQSLPFYVDRAFVEKIIKFIQQLLKVSSHRKACGENSLSKLWSSVPKHLFGFQGVCSPVPRAQSWRLKNPSELCRAFFKHLPAIKHRGLSLNTNCNTSSPLHILRALYLVLPPVFPIKFITMSQQERFGFLGYLQL